MTSTGVAAHARRWRLRDPEALTRALPRFPRITATVLAARGIVTRADADTFYKPYLAPVHDPLLLPGMETAIKRVRQAINGGELVALYGDFDVDGVTSVAVLTQGLAPLGARTTPYIPERFSEGYGLNSPAIERLHRQGVSLLITADCGISSVAEVAFANARGVDVIILDHHTVPEEMPAALAAVNPKREDSPYPFREMAAVGVSYRFLQVLYEACGRPLDESEFIDLVALGTVVDVAPLEDENRAMVVAGIEQMRRRLRPGLEALCEVAAVTPDRIGAETLGFALGPRMNAAGRLRHANIALQLMMARTTVEARPIARELDALNKQRQEQTEDACALAEDLLGSADDPLIMVGSPDIHAGIVGLVAARLAERRNRPAIVFEERHDESRASARSIPDFDIVAAIRKEKALLVKHGGHRAAAGFTVRNEHREALRERLVNTAAELLGGRDLRPVVMVDAETPLSEVAGIEIRGLMRFEPCGQGNRRPVLLSRNVEVRDRRAVGGDARHLKLLLRDGPAVWNAIAFNRADLPECDRVDIVYSLQQGWRGGVELEILDVAPTAEGHALEHG